MGRFSELGQNTNLVIQELLKDKELVKLVKYDSATPLSSPDVDKPSSLFFDRIFPIPRIPTIQETQKTIVTATFSNATLTSNIKFKEYKLIFSIISHIDIWRIQGSIRVYEIAERIDLIFNEKRGSPLSIGSVIFDSWTYREWNEKFCGYYLVYTVQNFN